MKTKIEIRTKDGSKKKIKGFKTQLKLKSGEIINVVVDKRKDKYYGNMWFVTHIESGLLIVPPQYYCFPRLIVDLDELDLDPDTKDNALEIAKYNLDRIYAKRGKTFTEIWNERERLIKEANNANS